jgi:hypothetical protein
MSANSTLPIVLGYAPRLPNKHGEINVTGAPLLAGIASQTREELLIEDQFILKSQKSIFNHRSGRKRWIMPGDRAYAGALAALQTIISLGSLYNVL